MAFLFRLIKHFSDDRSDHICYPEDGSQPIAAVNLVPSKGDFQ
jgi:hypothetical protein